MKHFSQEMVIKHLISLCSFMPVNVFVSYVVKLHCCAGLGIAYFGSSLKLVLRNGLLVVDSTSPIQKWRQQQENHSQEVIVYPVCQNRINQL